MSDPSANAPYHFLGATAAVTEPAPQPLAIAATPSVEPIDGEVLPPAPDAPALPPQYPIGLIDYNLPIAVVDNEDYNDEAFDSPAIITVLKGSLHPVVITFWKHGEQCVDQFDTDGDSASGNHKVEQELVYPATRYIVVGRKGRSLVVDEDLYASEEEANDKTSIEDVAGIFPVVVQAPAPTLADDVAGAGSVHDGIDEGIGDDSDGLEAEEGDNEIDADPEAPSAPEGAPTEMYVAGRTRRVGETVHAYRQGFGTRLCTIVKLRRDSRKSLFIDPRDGNEPYWALNKNVRY